MVHALRTALSAYGMHACCAGLSIGSYGYVAYSRRPRAGREPTGTYLEPRNEPLSGSAASSLNKRPAAAHNRNNLDNSNR